MLSFSDRYGYTHPSDALIIEQFPPEVANEVCTMFDRIAQSYTHSNTITFQEMEETVWCHYLHRRLNDFPCTMYEPLPVITDYLQDSSIAWYNKLNLLEFVLCTIEDYAGDYHDTKAEHLLKRMENTLNACFESLHYGYRVVDCQITSIVDKKEIASIEQAMNESNDNVREHLQQALNLFAKRPDPDYRNSIKESISAVECLAREITGESTLDRAFPKLKTNGVQLNSQFEEGLKRLYYYTNDGKTGIRHALMEDTYTPTVADAQYMLVTCSAFVNFIRSKMTANS